MRRIVALVHCFGDERRGFVADVTILAARITDACVSAPLCHCVKLETYNSNEMIVRTRTQRRQDAKTQRMITPLCAFAPLR